MPNACGWPGTSIQAGGSAYAARVPVDWLKSYDSFRPVPVWPAAGATEPLARAWLNFQEAASSKPATGTSVRPTVIGSTVVRLPTWTVTRAEPLSPSAFTERLPSAVGVTASRSRSYSSVRSAGSIGAVFPSAS